MFILVGVISAMPIKGLTGANDVKQVNKLVKVANVNKVTAPLPATMLAFNDVVQTHSTGAENLINKNTVLGRAGIESPKVPPQVWLILTALFCFVMRSSRRSV